MNKLFFIVVVFFIIACIIAFFFLKRTQNISELNPSNYNKNYKDSNQIEESPTDSFLRSYTTRETNLLQNTQEIEARFGSRDEFNKYLRELDINELIDLSRNFLKPNDKGILQYGIGPELIRHIRREQRIDFLMEIVEDREETFELRKYGFEILNGSYKYLNTNDKIKIIDAGSDVVFLEKDGNVELRYSALICTNHVISHLDKHGILPGEDIIQYCERLSDLFMDRNEEDILRGFAIEGVTALNYRQAKDNLIEILNSPKEQQNVYVMRGALNAIVYFDISITTINVIENLLDTTENSEVYDAAALSATKIGSEKSLKPLVDNVDRFNSGACQVAIEKHKDVIFKILSDVESPYLHEAIQASKYLYHETDIDFARKQIFNILPKLNNNTLISSALENLYQIGTKEEFEAIVKLVPRKPGYCDAWDAVYRRSGGIKLHGQTSTEKVGE